MERTDVVPPAQARAHRDGNTLSVRVGGCWRVTARVPGWAEQVKEADGTGTVRIEPAELEAWDSSLALFLRDAARWADAHGARLDASALPAGLQRLAERRGGQAAAENIGPAECTPNLLVAVGLITRDLFEQIRQIARFVGECTLSAYHLLKNPHRFRWHDCVEEMQQCGAMALPIVGLISFLVGLIMAFQAAIQLRQFGADIFVADLVGLSVVREMGPMMAAVVLAGRTGAAFAATLGTMKVGEEIDALETFGIAPVDFLVMPRIAALLVMMPLLALYANALGIFGGMVVSAGLLDIPPNAYWIETKSIIDLSDVSSGLIKSVSFGLLIGLSGCLRGLQCERSAAGIGRAATSAVVTGVLLIIVSDAVFAVIFNVVGL